MNEYQHNGIVRTIPYRYHGFMSVKDKNGKLIAPGQTGVLTLAFSWGEITAHDLVKQINTTTGRIEFASGTSLSLHHSTWFAADNGGDNPPGGPPNGAHKAAAATSAAGGGDDPPGGPPNGGSH